MTCRCRRKICLCCLSEEPTAAAIEILDAARASILAERAAGNHVIVNAKILDDAIDRLMETA